MDDTLIKILNSASLKGACYKSKNISDYKSLVWLFFTPQGREFCESYNFPSIELFREMKDKIRPHGVYVDAGDISIKNESNIGLIGNTNATLTIDDNTKVHKIILMHGANATIIASNYAVILVENAGKGKVTVEKDNTSVIL